MHVVYVEMRLKVPRYPLYTNRLYSSKKNLDLDLDRYVEDINSGFYSTEVSARFDTIDVGIHWFLKFI